MDKSKSPALVGLVAASFLLTREVPTSFALDKPYHTSILVLASCAATLLVIARFLPEDHGKSKSSIPLKELGRPHSSRDASLSPGTFALTYSPRLRRQRFTILVFVVAICLRVETLRQAASNTKCTSSGWGPLIPCAFALWDYRAAQRHKKQTLNGKLDDEVSGPLTRAPSRYLIACCLVGFGSIIALYTSGGPASTFICFASPGRHFFFKNSWKIGSILDLGILACANRLMNSQEVRIGGRGFGPRFLSVGYAFLWSAMVLSVVALLYYVLADYDRQWMLAMPGIYLRSAWKLSALVSFSTVCTLLAISHVGVTTTSLILLFCSVCTYTTISAWGASDSYFPTYPGTGLFAILLILLGFTAYLRFDSVMENRDDRRASPRRTFFKVPSWLYFGILALFIVRAGNWAAFDSELGLHPIDLLIHKANVAHNLYKSQAASSQSLNEAVSNYRTRYGQNPPPNFEHWYAYATARKSFVIDDFDSIDRDLLPFYAVKPADLRHRTWQMVSNPWHDAAGLSVRDGKVTISPGVVPTHRWMLDGMVEMIGNFAEFLPDMDLAFNVNDECRVSVPFNDIESMRTLGLASRTLKTNTRNSFSEKRSDQWQAIPEPPNEERVLKELSWQQTFYKFGNSGCPSNSLARNRRVWDVSTQCTDCASPHSDGAFLGNWSRAGDICHQPDVADLYGQYIAPAAFKGSHSLYPLFSQSKMHGFNDILYPSAWNYMNKVKYEPSGEYPDKPFTEKQNSIFWRGTTTEAVSPGAGQWKGMTRQRFLYLANNVNNDAAPQALLLGSSGGSTQRWKYRNVAASQLTKLMQTDIHVVDFIARCGQRDCPAQEKTFAPLLNASDFQAHWGYKYVLDLDGAGFSGRFLSFLQSNSLPFKASLVREWWDDRVTPWYHFVPLDIRGQGFWATLAYFAGVDGKVGWRRVTMDGNEKMGEQMAEEGREWAAKVLRREDMEIYVFRLLLEWGRLTDDRRDEIGYFG